MWPSEEAVSRQIIPLFIESGIDWIVTDESLLLKTLGREARSPDDIYRAYTFVGTNGLLNILFRDKNLSDLISFVYQHWDSERAVDDFMDRLKVIKESFKDKDCLVVLALDGENAWGHYKNNGKDFLNLLYSVIAKTEFIKTVTVNEYLGMDPQKAKLSSIASGSWVNGDFSKWIGNPVKNKAWAYLLDARKVLERMDRPSDLALKQLYILEGSDWFWWYGDGQKQFDELFRMHLKNFYKIINHSPQIDLDRSLE